MQSSAPFVAFVLLCLLPGCTEPPPDISGTWFGEASAIVDAEETTIKVDMEIEQREADVEGNVYWGPIEATISSAEFFGPQLVVVSEWPEGTMTFRGRVIENTFKGRFRIKHEIDPYPFQGTIELTRE